MGASQNNEIPSEFGELEAFVELLPKDVQFEYLDLLAALLQKFNTAWKLSLVRQTVDDSMNVGVSYLLFDRDSLRRELQEAKNKIADDARRRADNL